MQTYFHSPYEISLWKDDFIEGVYEQTDDAEHPYEIKYKVKPENYEIGENEGIFTYCKESKVAIIGSDTMTSPARAQEPALTRNVNGTFTLSFYIYNNYYDEKQEDYTMNPFKNFFVSTVFVAECSEIGVHTSATGACPALRSGSHVDGDHM